jgi:Membrane protein involved in the export of O-antigen and teichoic acid
MLRKLFSHTAIYGLAPYIPKIFGFVTLPIITRDLTSFDYGIAGLIGAYAGALSVFNTLGLRLVVVNAFYHYRSQFKWLWRQVYGFLSIWVWVFAILISTVFYFVIPEEAGDNTFLIIALNAIPLVFFGPVVMLGTTYYQLNQQPIQIAGRTVVFSLMTIALNIYLISVQKLGYMGWFWTDCIVGMLQNASFWYAVNVKLRITPIFNFKWRVIKRSLRVSLPVIPHYYATYLLNSSDRMVMDWVKMPTEQIGRYNLAANFGNYFNSVSMASGFAVGPMLNSNFKNGRDVEARNLLWVLQVAFFIGTFLFSLWSKEIFFFLIQNDVLRETYPLAIIIVMSYNYRPMYLGANAKLFFVEKTNVLWRVTFVAGVLNVFLNLVFIPLYGIIVAAVTTFICYMYMGYVGFFLDAHKLNNSVRYYPLAWLCGTIGLTALVYALVEIHPIFKLFVTFTVALIGLGFYKKFQTELNRS